MSAFQEVMQAVMLFVLALIIIPVGIFTADILKNYYTRGDVKNDMGTVSRKTQKR